jgi:acyl carrier protein
MGEFEDFIDDLLREAGLDVVHLERSWSLVDAGASSFSIMRFLMNLEAHLSVELSEEQMAEIINGPISAIAETAQQAVAGH